MWGRRRTDHSRYGRSQTIVVSNPPGNSPLLYGSPSSTCDTVSGATTSHSSLRMARGMPRRSPGSRPPNMALYSRPIDEPLMPNATRTRSRTAYAARPTRSWRRKGVVLGWMSRRYSDSSA